MSHFAVECGFWSPAPPLRLVFCGLENWLSNFPQYHPTVVQLLCFWVLSSLIVFPGLWHSNMSILHKYTSSSPFIKSFEPHVTWAILSFFPILQTFLGFTIQFLSMEGTLAASALFLTNDAIFCGKAGRLSDLDPQFMLKSQLNSKPSKRIVFLCFVVPFHLKAVSFLFWICWKKITPWVSGTLVCITDTSSSVTSAELDANEAAHQLWRSNTTWWSRLALVLSCILSLFAKVASHPRRKLQCTCTEWMHFKV